MPTLPSENDLKKLPPLAIVAYAARCARRVQPLFRPDGDHHATTLDTLITTAQAIARGYTKDIDFETLEEYPTVGVVGAAVEAAKAADAALQDNVNVAATYAVVASMDAAGVISTIDTHAHCEYIDAIKLDYHRLCRMPYPEPGQAINYNDLGPLWPNGEPSWVRGIEVHVETTTTEKKKSIKVTRSMLLNLLADANVEVPEGAEITVRVPGGGDWSNTDLHLGDDTQAIDICWVETS